MRPVPAAHAAQHIHTHVSHCSISHSNTSITSRGRHSSPEPCSHQHTRAPSQREQSAQASPPSQQCGQQWATHHQQQQSGLSAQPQQHDGATQPPTRPLRCASQECTNPAMLWLSVGDTTRMLSPHWVNGSIKKMLPLLCLVPCLISILNYCIVVYSHQYALMIVRLCWTQDL